MTETLTVRLDHETKKAFEDACNTLGISMGTAVNMLAKTMGRTYQIPAELCKADRFYSESNMKALQKSIKQLDEGKVVYKTMEELEAMADE